MTNQGELDCEQARTIETLLDARPMRPIQLWAVATCMMVAFLDGYDLQIMALSIPSIAREWALPVSAFGTALSAALLGLGLGGLLLGPLGDRWGRKPIIISATMLVGLGSLGVTTADTVLQLIFWRLLTGLGFGAALPSIYALTSDYAPLHLRIVFLTALACMLSIGAFVAGLLAPSIIAAHGWHGLFIIGGVAPFAVGLIVAWSVPESVKFMLVKTPESQHLSEVLRHLLIFQRPEVVEPEKVSRQSVRMLLQPAYRRRTIFLWLTWSINSFSFYSMASWLPSLLQETGLSSSDSLQVSSYLWAGAVVGGLLLSWLVSRIAAKALAIIGTLMIAMAGLAMLPFLPPDAMLWSMALMLIGAALGGTQFVLSAIGALIYPSALMATGTGWGTSIARGGATLGPIAGGLVLHAVLTPGETLALLMAPVLISQSCVWFLFQGRSDRIGLPLLNIRTIDSSIRR